MLKVSLIQFEPLLGNLDKTIKNLQKLLPLAKQSDLIVLPELTNSGYNFESLRHAYELSEEIRNSMLIKYLKEWAGENDTYIVTGVNEREDFELFNSAVLIGPEGEIGKYRKIHLFMNEKEIFLPGNLGLPVFEVKGVKIGMLICFDYCFPEIWRILAMKGAEVICHPSNLVTPYGRQTVPVHSIINRVFIITANRIGTEKEITFNGRSIVSDPTGRILYKAPADIEEVGNVELDIELARNKWITEKNHVFDDRRPEIYKDLCKDI